MTNFISNETIDAILDSPDLISIIGEYTRLEQRSPNDWWGCCPFHGEKTPSFHVDANQKFYYCFGCHKGGNIISFVMEMENVNIKKVMKTPRFLVKPGLARSTEKDITGFFEKSACDKAFSDFFYIFSCSM